MSAPSYDIISLFYLFSLPQFSLSDNEKKKEKRDFFKKQAREKFIHKRFTLKIRNALAVSSFIFCFNMYLNSISTCLYLFIFQSFGGGILEFKKMYYKCNQHWKLSFNFFITILARIQLSFNLVLVITYNYRWIWVTNKCNKVCKCRNFAHWC